MRGAVPSSTSAPRPARQDLHAHSPPETTVGLKTTIRVYEKLSNLLDMYSPLTTQTAYWLPSCIHSTLSTVSSPHKNPDYIHTAWPNLNTSPDRRTPQIQTCHRSIRVLTCTYHLMPGDARTKKKKRCVERRISHVMRKECKENSPREKCCTTGEHATR